MNTTVIRNSREHCGILLGKYYLWIIYLIIFTRNEGVIRRGKTKKKNEIDYARFEI